MTDELLPFYEQELKFIRGLGEQFAEEHPRIAGRLRLGAVNHGDPHVERMIQAFAFLNARIRHKLDDDFPEITDALLGVLYPHLQQPIPSMSVVQFVMDRGQADLVAGYRIPPVAATASAARQGAAIETEPVAGQRCRYQTAFPVTIWPFDLEGAELAGRPFAAPATRRSAQAVAVLRIELATFSEAVHFSQFDIGSLRFYLHAARGQNVWPLYELIFANTLEIALAGDDPRVEPVVLPKSSIRPVGFERDEGLIPISARSFVGYRLLSEFFAFPNKFLFFDLAGLTPERLARFGNRMQIYFYLSRTSAELERSVTRETLRLGCAPMINLFKHRADPFVLTQHAAEYPLVLDARCPHALEVYSVDRVVATSPEGESVEYRPFYSFKHATDQAEQQAFWRMTRRPGVSAPGGGAADEGTDAFLSFLDLEFSPAAPADWTIDVETTCLNRDLPAHLPFGGNQPELDMPEGRGPVARVVCLTPPTKTLRPPLKHRALWRFVSHLSLNHLSIAEGDEAAESLREILRLHDLANSAETRAMLEGLTAVRSRRVVGRVDRAFCRGIEMDVEFDESRFSGSGAYLFACILERFFGLYSSINSFSTMVAACSRRDGQKATWKWPLRSGARIVL